MAAHISGIDLSLGGYTWRWMPRQQTFKRVGSAGIVGDYRKVTRLGSRTGMIVGVMHGEQSAVLNAIAVIESLQEEGIECAWEDSEGRSGNALVVERFDARDVKHYGNGSLWVDYELTVNELDGF